MQIKKTKHANTLISRPFSLTIFFYLNKNFQEESESLISFLQQYHLTVERIKGKGDRQRVPSSSISYKNANFVARTDHNLSVKECALLSQFLLSKVIVLAFFYHGQMLSVSRLQDLQKKDFQFLEQNQAKMYPFHALWNDFYGQYF